MKTNELLKLLKKNGCSLIRHGSNHDIWYSSVTGKQFAVPRHKKEIKTGTAIAICAMPEWILRKEILMSKYVYPAIFTSEPDGGYSVYFPDLEGCYTCGDTLADALFMAEDALALILYGYEKDQRPIPQPSKMSGIKVTADSFLSMVACDTLEYRKRFNNKAVKKH